MKVSVLTPTIRGREWFLDRCRRSVMAQGYEPLEHVVVAGDGLSASQAFQVALEAATGELVIPVSDDDWIAPHAVEMMVQAMGSAPSGPPYEVMVGQTVISSPGSSRIEHGVGAVMWRKALTDRIGGFDPRFRFAADTELYKRFGEANARIGYLAEPLYFLTEHELHGSYVHREELALELEEIEEMYPHTATLLPYATVAGG